MRRLALLALALGLSLPAAFPLAAQAAFGVESTEVSLRDESAAKAPLLQAGAHPVFSIGFKLNSYEAPPSEPGGGRNPEGNAKDVEATLPVGLVGSPAATPRCSQFDFALNESVANCEPNTQVGIATIDFQGEPTEVPLYNLDPPRGTAGQFGFIYGGALIFVNATVTAEGGYHLRAKVAEISQGLPLTGTRIELWGVPAADSHNMQRAEKGAYFNYGNPVPSQAPRRPFVTNPTACSGTPQRFGLRVDFWQAPGAFETRTLEADPGGTPLTVTGCEKVPFEGSIEAAPTTAQADSPTGLDVDVDLTQNANPLSTGNSDLRDAVVTLPEGMTVNPALASGLAACSVAQIGLDTDLAPSCPEGSKIGTVSVRTPLLDDPLVGSVYLAQQRQNRFGSLLALYLVVDDPERGVLIKIPGKVEPDPTTGRLVARFTDAPQLPFENLHVSLFGGPRAALVNPPACGTYATAAEYVPWSGGAPVRDSSSFQVTSGPNGAACPNGAFSPTLEGGSSNAAAGEYSPFELRFARGDGSERLGRVGATLPRGLLARLTDIPYCADPSLAAVPTAEGTGAAQLASPSCPAASRVGSVAVAAGAGPSPLWVKTGSAYLAGPYRGAPLSLAIVTPALAGPFDLGNVVVRVALRVDPVTAQVSAESDPLPTILAGIPLDLRAIDVKLDRQPFVVNPTSCEAGRIETTLVSVGGKPAHPSLPFAASSCGGLGFSPKVKLKLKGGTRRGAYPALTATVESRRGEANIARAAVGLPHSEFLAQNHIGTICTRVQFAANNCPQASIYGYAEATTPLLGKPLRGPVYLRSSSHQLPDLVAALRGQIAIDLAGRIDSKNRGIRATFESVPDAPISRFVLRMRGGKKGLLVNSTQICRNRGKAQLRLRGQNGAEQAKATPLAASCGAKGKKKRSKR